MSATAYGLRSLDALGSSSTGIAPTDDGRFCALTATASRTFATVRGAAQWLAKRGYAPTGERLPAPSL